MKEQTKVLIGIGILAAVNAGIGAIDVGANIISVVPGVGDLAETASESILETIQVVVNIVGGFILTAMKR
jgi:hypothetical protein